MLDTKPAENGQILSPVNDWEQFVANVDKSVLGVGMNRRAMFAFWWLNTENKVVMNRATFNFPHASFNEALAMLNRDLVREAGMK